MSGLLAGLKVEMTYLQRENDEQAAKLRELEFQKMELKQQYQEQADELLTIKARTNTTENQVNALTREGEEQAAKLRELESQKTELKQQYQEQAAKLRELESQKMELKQQYQEQADELLTIKARTNTTENQVNALTREGEVKRVAFSASLLSSGSQTIGPFNALTNLVFRNVVTNFGNAYNPNTVLREMSGLLAGLKVEMTYLQRENEAQSAKLNQLESQKTELKVEMTYLQRENEEQAAKLRELEFQKTELKQQYQGH
ncbi:uncharacterized protein FYW49_005121 [Xenentodon cancila]